MYVVHFLNALFSSRYRHGGEQQGFGGNKRYWNPNQPGNGNMFGGYNPNYKGKQNYQQQNGFNGKKKSPVHMMQGQQNQTDQHQQNKSSNESSPQGSPINNKGKQNNSPVGEGLQKPQWDVNALMPFRKNFYVPHKSTTERYLFLFSLA